jgi:hypothetical protein
MHEESPWPGGRSEAVIEGSRSCGVVRFFVDAKIERVAHRRGIFARGHHHHWQLRIQHAHAHALKPCAPDITRRSFAQRTNRSFTSDVTTLGSASVEVSPSCSGPSSDEPASAILSSTLGSLISTSRRLRRCGRTQSRGLFSAQAYRRRPAPGHRYHHRRIPADSRLDRSPTGTRQARAHLAACAGNLEDLRSRRKALDHAGCRIWRWLVSRCPAGSAQDLNA